MSLTTPSLNAIPFGTASLKNTIPDTTTGFGVASFTGGFPNETMLDPTSGGIAPDGKDFNGILNQLSQHQVWLNAGGQYKYDAALATAAGGYALGAVVQSDDNTKSYVNMLDGNSSNPNTGGANWSVWSDSGLRAELALSTGSSLVGFLQSGAGAVLRTLQSKDRDVVSVKDFGAIGDGTLHTVLEWYTIGSPYYRGFADLAAVQAVYPHVYASTDTIDFAGVQAAVNSLVNGGIISVSDGHYIFAPVNNGAALVIPTNVTLVGKNSSTIFELITDITDMPSVSTNWDFILMSGTTNTGGGVKNITFKHTGGRRNNCATIAVRNGATKKVISGNTFDYTIASAIVLEGNVASPYPTQCLVKNNSISNTGRHGVYISGCTHNTVTLNQFFTTGLESTVIRNADDNDIICNEYTGGSTTLYAAIALAAPPTGSAHKVSRLKVIENRILNYYGAGFYGQGVGCSLVDSTIKDNTINLAADISVTDHSLMFYKTSNCIIEGNIIYGGQNRGMMFYGCSNNKIKSNTIRNVNAANAAVGAMVFVDYTDLNGQTFSTKNKISDCTIVDDRVTPLHVYGIQFLTGSNNNKVRSCEITGQTSTPIFSADGLQMQDIGSEVEKFQWYTPTAIPAGGATTAATQASVIGNSYVSVVNVQSYLKLLRVTTRQTVTSGTISANLYRNGSFLFAVALAGNASVLTKATQFNKDQIVFAEGDVLTAFIAGTSVVSGSGSIDCTVHVVTAN